MHLSKVADLPCEPASDVLLSLRAQQELVKQAASRLPITYDRLGIRIAASSADAIGSALSETMDRDASERRPFLAALAVKSVSPGLPDAWFFNKARTLGRFDGHPGDVEAYAFHTEEIRRAIVFYSASSEAAKP